MHEFDPRSAMEVSPEERQAQYERLWQEAGFKKWLSNFRDVMVPGEANEDYAEFVRNKIRERVNDPVVAEMILSAVGRPERIQALVHLGDEPEYLDRMFDALGERIAHVHVNFLRQGAPALLDIADDVRTRVAQIRARGFVGSYTIEFVKGVGSEADQPAALLDAAIADLALLREILAT